MAMPAASYLIVPYASDDPGGEVLLARVNLANMRAQRGPSPQIIPDHAGQWTLIGDGVPATPGQSPVAGAFKLFAARTGLNLSDPAVLTRFGFSTPTLKALQDPRTAADFTAVYLQTTAAKLLEFAGVITANLGSTTTDGVLVEVKALAIADALSQIGPVAKPASGWRGVIVDRVYGGRLPQAMDTTFPTLVNQIAARSQEREDWYRIALAQLPGGDVPPVPQPRLVRLEVDNAQPITGAANAYAATYESDPNAAVTVRAVIEPSSAATGITWTGGRGTGDRCTVSLNQITKAGQPLTVTATLGRAALSVTLIIRPQLVGATVTGATRSEGEGSPTEQVWLARYDETETAQITIAMAPDTPDAYDHLQWTGGQPGRAKNVRLVPRNTLTAADQPLRLRAAVNPWYDFIFYVFPWLRRVEVAPAAGVYNAGGGNYEVDYLNPGQYTVRAVIVPNIAFARQFVTMLQTPPAGGPAAPMPAGITHNVDRFPIDTFGAPTTYTAEVRRGPGLAGLYQSETARVLVQPVLNALAPVGCAIAVPGLANTWYSYNVSQPLGGGGAWRPNVAPVPPVRIEAQMTFIDAATLASAALAGLPGAPPAAAVDAATVAADTVAAAGHVRWGPAFAAGAGAVQNVPLNAVANHAFQARIGQDATPARRRPLTLNVLARENYAAGNPHLAMTNATFAGGGAVICDNTTMAYGLAFNAPFNGPHWVAGRAHNLQEPRTYAGGAVIQQSATLATPVPPVGAPVNVNIRATAFVPQGTHATTRITWGGGAWNGVVVAPAGGAIALGVVAGAPALPAAEVVFADPLPMFWEMQVGAGPWVLFDMTSQIVYVTRAAPVGYFWLPPAGAAPPAVPAPVLYHTPLAISCRAAHGATTNARVLERNYSVFQALAPANGANANLDPPFPAPGGGPPRPDRLGYWKGHWVAGFNPNFTVQTMLQAGDGVGTCGAFAELLVAMGALHGINTLHVVGVVPGVDGGGVARGDGILVRNWTFNAAPAAWPALPVPQPPAAYTHYQVAQPIPPAVPAAPGAGNAAWGLPPGLVGQNDATPPQDFGDHAIVLDVSTAAAGTSGTIYDPSYGSAPVTTAANYAAAAIAGLYLDFNFVGGGGPTWIAGYQAMPAGTLAIEDLDAVVGGLITPTQIL